MAVVAKLTDAYVRGLLADDRQQIYWETETPGFGIRVTPNGAKSWVAEYRANGGGRRAQTSRVTIASFAIMNASKARAAAKDILASVRLGADPAEKKRSGRVAVSIEELSVEFLKPDAKADRKASTTKLYDLYFRKHINPALGSKRAQDVSHDDIVKLHRQIGAAQPATANRVVLTLSGLFTWALKKRKIDRPDNPAKNVDLFREKARERYLSTDELGRLGEALREAETVGLVYEINEAKPKSKHAPKPDNRRTIIDAHAAAAIRLLLLTGARLREILHLKWSNVDIERGFLTLDDSKTGRKTIVLNAPSLQILDELPRIGSLVIASRSSGTDVETPRADLQRPWAAIIKRANLGGLRIHDLRHTHASIGAGAGVGLPIIGKLLGHRQSETTAKYAHLADDPLRRASERIGGDLAAAMGEARQGGAEVIKIAEGKR